MTSTQRVLTLVGDPNQINTWSNIPYFFLKAGQAAGFLHRGLPLQPEKLNLQRLLWNGWQHITTAHHGGFQYSTAGLNRLFAQAKLGNKPTDIISHFPLLPPMPWPSSWSVSYYLDATTKQIFEDYGLRTKVSPNIRRTALEREKANFQACDRIICMSTWAAQSVVKDYGICSSKVHIIPGGANLDDEALPPSSAYFSPLQPLRLGFVGKDWNRKGLPYLLQIADVLLKKEMRVEVVVVGPSTDDLPTHPAIRSVGFINKSTHLADYVQLVQSFHFGCLFSAAEAFGISNVECLRLGVPAIAHRVGGIPATLPEELGHLFIPGTPPHVVANVLATYIQDLDRYAELRQRVAARAKEFSWNNTVHKFIQLWQGADTFSYDHF
ncbi:glycosyltransferase family 4 protein [Nodosilinea sp. LEGE 06152]|uniref:glycosyltransferase family 4 protein n=1 Tax=Nodosilinea sp. LEGE 06152 TaxID=2777966 RepID=UPI001881B459|nr:glycosyltransferase family 4 protein [Nodosilinea sp. LEGE 06152]MBE9158405.1 glycosyltransferase family 4 protein [Nodosilinea sp. LEGE 06152]